MKNVLVEDLDHFGRGIAHLNSKIVFINNTTKGDVVDIKIISDKKNFSEAKVTKFITKSKDRVEPLCPYFNICGGCHLQFLKYEDTLTFKKKKVKDLITKNKINYHEYIEIIKNSYPYNYRNKISLKIKEGKIGYYEESTHKLVPINNCLIASSTINKVINNYGLLNIQNGSLTIRSNQNEEVLIIINSNNNDYDIDILALKSQVKVVGIVYNDKTIYGDNFLYERLNGFLFKISYNSFFQINPYITEQLFNLINENITTNSTVLDLYSGVGTLSIVSSQKAKEVIGIEIIPNAVINSTFNAKINKRDNVKFLLGDVKDTINKLKKEFDTVIVDPPRKGLDKNTLDFLIKSKIKKIIYISCDASTLMRDLKILTNTYEIKGYKILDMFSYSYHLESFVILSLIN